jgi:hypothetical protein
MIIGFADHEGGGVANKIEVVYSIGQWSNTVSKNGSWSIECDGDLDQVYWHNHIRTTGVTSNDDTAPLNGYPGWEWWALGGWLNVDDVPDSGKVSMLMNEDQNVLINNWGISLNRDTATTYKFWPVYNLNNLGAGSIAFNVGTWYWVVWVMTRHKEVALWVDGTKRVSWTSTDVDKMNADPCPSYISVEKDGKTTVNSLWNWDTNFLQDDYGFENADTPLVLNSAGLRVPVLTEAGSDKGGCASGLRDWTGITLTSEYLRAVSLHEDDDASGKVFQFKACDGSTTWNVGYDVGWRQWNTRNTIRQRYPTGGRWTEALFDPLAWGPRINRVYPLIATVDEGLVGVATRYKGLDLG